MPQLLARIAALFRRREALKAPVDNNIRLSHGNLVIDKNCLLIEWKGQKIDFTLTEFWIVCSLAAHLGHVKSRDQLMNDANIYVDDTTVTSHIKRIRKKFIETDNTFDCIETIYGMGYRWKTA